MNGIDGTDSKMFRDGWIRGLISAVRLGLRYFGGGGGCWAPGPREKAGILCMRGIFPVGVESSMYSFGGAVCEFKAGGWMAVRR